MARAAATAKPQTSLQDITKMGIPAVVALGLGLTFGRMVFGAGGEVASNAKDIAYLTSKCDQLAAAIKDLNVTDTTLIKENHDAVLELRVKLDSLKEYVNAMEAGNNITIHDDATGKSATIRNSK